MVSVVAVYLRRDGEEEAGKDKAAVVLVHIRGGQHHYIMQGCIDPHVLVWGL